MRSGRDQCLRIAARSKQRGKRLQLDAFERNRLRASLEQRVAERLGHCALDAQRERDPGHHLRFFSSCASFCSR